ncbi:MAG: ABC transporter permease [Sporolactobacillus sp.]
MIHSQNKELYGENGRIVDNVRVDLTENRKKGKSQFASEEDVTLNFVKLRKKYWKPASLFWNLASCVILVLALLENLLIPNQQDVNDRSYQIFMMLFLLYQISGTLLSLRLGKIRFRFGHKARFIVLIGLLLIVSDLLTEKFGILQLPFYVSFAQILDTLVEDRTLLFQSTVSSLFLWMTSFIIGSVIGIAIGLLVGRYREFNYWSFPILKVIGIIPAAAWMPIAMILFPTSFLSEVFLIVLSVWFPVAFMTMGGVQGISKTYFEAAETLGANEYYVLRHVIIPGAMPSIFIGIFTATGLSFTMLVVSEMIGAKAGLGWYINWAKGVGNYGQVYTAILIMAVLFSLIFALILRAQDYFLKWKENY